MARKPLPDHPAVLETLQGQARRFIEAVDPLLTKFRSRNRILEDGVKDPQVIVQQSAFLRQLHQGIFQDIAGLGPCFSEILPYIDLDAKEAALFLRKPAPLSVTPDSPSWVAENVRNLVAMEMSLRGAVNIVRRLHKEVVAKLENPNRHSVAGNLFRREGRSWSVRFGDILTSIEDLRGMSYIAQLLARPGMEVPVSELREADVRRRAGTGDKLYSTMSKEVVGETALGKEGLGGGVQDLGPITDREALRAYKERLDELERELNTAGENHDDARVAKLVSERHFILDEIRGSTGKGGRSRKVSSVIKNDLDAVRNAINRSLFKIGEKHEGLANHLRKSLEIGSLCRYAPENTTLWEA